MPVRSLIQRMLLPLGLAWPFIVAGATLGALCSIARWSDNVVYLGLVTSLLGAPAVLAGLVPWLPTAWPESRRDLMALLLTSLLVSGDIVVAGWLFLLGALHVGLLV